VKVVSFLWSLLNAVARLRAKPQHLGVKTYLIGNLEVGGTGKTPLVMGLANHFHQKGARVALLMRAYRSGLKSGEVRTWLPGEGILDPQHVGDEAALYASRLPFVALGMGPDRVRSFRALQAFKPTVVLMDDGFQSNQVHADATFLVVTDRKHVLRRDFDFWAKKASCLIALKGPMPDRFRSLPWLELPSHYGIIGPPGPVILVTGVGFPEQVQATLSKERDILKSYLLRDHESPSLDVLLKWSQHHMLAGTEKDWVKWRAIGYRRPGVVLDMSVSLEPLAGSEEAYVVWRKHGFSSSASSL
jgi:tetraacyldisaccharide-1-P 4'-kinase